jgi:hypothetical protein
MAKRSRAAGGGADSEAKWARRVERLERSGLSIRTFAAREGLPAGSLSSWKWKLAQRRGRAAGAGKSHEAPLRFVELKAPAAAQVGVPAASVPEPTVRLPRRGAIVNPQSYVAS